MFPRKFLYEQSTFTAKNFYIELSDRTKLKLGSSTYGSAALPDQMVTVAPTSAKWLEFKVRLNNFDFHNLEDEEICDGTQLEFWCTYRRSIKFNCSVGDATKLGELQALINPLTICDDYPLGLFSG